MNIKVDPFHTMNVNVNPFNVLANKSGKIKSLGGKRMNRIEEIKKRVNKKYDAVSDGLTDCTVHLQATDDVKYLLSKLKQAEEDIQTAYDYISQTDRVIHKRQLLNALKSIREG